MLKLLQAWNFLRTFAIMGALGLHHALSIPVSMCSDSVFHVVVMSSVVTGIMPAVDYVVPVKKNHEMRSFSYFFIILIFLSQGCTFRGEVNDNSSLTIHVDCDSISWITLKDYPFIQLSNSEPLGQIKHVEFLDNYILIHSGGKLEAFDIHSGRKICQYSRQGRSTQEYVSLWGFNVFNNTVILHDLSGEKMMYYSKDGTWIKNFGIKERPRFQAFAPLNNGLIIGKRRYEGTETTELSLWDKDYNYIGDL